MKPFYLNFKTAPLAHNPLANELGGAAVSMWVFDETIAGATDRAVRYIKECGWEAIEVECAFQPPAEHIADLDKDESANFRHAELYGISAHFDAWPKVAPSDADADRVSKKSVRRKKK